MPVEETSESVNSHEESESEISEEDYDHPNESESYPLNPTNRLRRRLEREWDGSELDDEYEEEEGDQEFYDAEDQWFHSTSSKRIYFND